MAYKLLTFSLHEPLLLDLLILQFDFSDTWIYPLHLMDS